MSLRPLIKYPSSRKRKRANSNLTRWPPEIATIIMNFLHSKYPEIHLLSHSPIPPIIHGPSVDQLDYDSNVKQEGCWLIKKKKWYSLGNDSSVIWFPSYWTKMSPSSHTSSPKIKRKESSFHPLGPLIKTFWPTEIVAVKSEKADVQQNFWNMI